MKGTLVLRWPTSAIALRFFRALSQLHAHSDYLCARVGVRPNCREAAEMRPRVYVMETRELSQGVWGARLLAREVLSHVSPPSLL